METKSMEYKYRENVDTIIKFLWYNYKTSGKCRKNVCDSLI